VCCGVTSMGDWKQYKKGAFVDINSKKCKFSGTPVYFSSLLGNSHHWTTTGATSHFRVRPTGFRVAIAGLRYASRFKYKYKVSWCGIGRVRGGQRKVKRSLCCGHVETWKKYGSHMMTDISMKRCGFKRTPKVFTSLFGTSSHWILRQPSAVYGLNRNKFRVYIHGSRPSQAKKYKYSLQWCAVAVTKFRSRGRNYPCNGARKLNSNGSVAQNNGRVCCGRAYVKWNNYSSNGVTARVATTRCKFKRSPTYFSSVGGTNLHDMTTGANAIYSPSRAGFTVYLHGFKWTLRKKAAVRYGFNIEWCGVE